MGTDVHTTDSPGTRPKIIRNREVDKAASALAEDHLLPLPPGKELDWKQMQDYLALLTPAMWSHVLVYLYRMRPRIIRQLSDAKLPNYIDCFGECFTMEYIISRHGGGKYSFQACDTERRKDNEKSRLFTCVITIDEAQHPPILNFPELVIDARENRSYVTWLQSQGILDAKGNVVPPSTNSSNGADIVKEVLNFVKQERPQTPSEEQSLGKAIGNILVERMKQDDPVKQYEVMTNLFNALKDDPSKQMQVMSGWLSVLKEMRADGGAAAAMYDKLLAMQSEQNKTALQMQADYNKLVMSMMEKAFQQNQNPAPRAPLDDWDKMFSIIDRAAHWRGGGSGARSGWDTGLEFARDVGLPALQSIGNTIASIMSLRRNGAPMAPMQAAPVAFDPYQNPQAARAYASTLPQQQPQQPPPPPQPPPAQPPPQQQGPDANQLMTLFQSYGGLVIGALNSNTPGHYFGENLVGLMGAGTHAMISSHGEDALVQCMMAIPDFQLYGEPRLRRFANEFINYEELLAQEAEAEEEEVREPDEVEPAPPAPRAARPAPHRTVNAK